MIVDAEGLHALCVSIEEKAKLKSADNKHVRCKYLAVNVADLVGFFVVEVCNLLSCDEDMICVIKQLCGSNNAEVESDVSNKRLMRVLVPKPEVGRINVADHNQPSSAVLAFPFTFWRYAWRLRSPWRALIEFLWWLLLWTASSALLVVIEDQCVTQDWVWRSGCKLYNNTALLCPVHNETFLVPMTLDCFIKAPVIYGGRHFCL